MITSYPDKNSLKEVFSTGLSITSLKNICKENGVFLLSMDKDTVIRDAHLFYWGYMDINRMSSSMEDEKNYKKSFRLKVIYNQDTDEKKILFDEFYNRMIAYRNALSDKTGIKFESLRIVDEESTEEKCLVGELSYKRKRPGKVELLSETTQRLKFQANVSNDNSILIDFIFNDRGDISIAKKMITDAISATEEFSAPTQISLKTLSTEERVDLFDEFFGYTFEHWRVDSIRNIKVKKNSDEEIDADEEEEVQDDILTGVESALLSGSGLRSNKIVVDAVNRGYFFPKATVMFEHRMAAQKVLIDVSFNSDDLLLEVTVLATYDIEEGRDYKHPVSEEEQASVLSEFHDGIQEIYKKKLISRSEAKAVKRVPIASVSENQ